MIDKEFFYNALFQNGGQGIWILDHNFKILDVNPALNTLLKCAPDSLRNRSFFDFLNEQSSVILQTLDFSSESSSRAVEVELRAKDGDPIPCILNLAPLQNAGTHQGFIVTVVPLAETRKDEEILRSTLYGMDEGIILEDLKGKILLINPAACRILDTTSEEAIRIHPFKKWNTLSEEGYPFPVHQQLMLGSQTMEGRVIPIFSDDSSVQRKKKWLYISVNPLFLSGRSEPFASIISFHDVTSMKETARSSQESLQMLQLVLDGLDALVYVADMETYEVLFVNQYTRQLVGDVTGRKCWQSLQYNQNGPCPFCTNAFLVDSSGRSSGVYTYEFINTITGRWYHIQDRAIYWINNRMVRLEIAIDITDRKEATEKLELRTEQLEGLNRDLEKRVQEEIEKRREHELMLTHQARLASMGEMIGAIAHRWRQPLNTIGLIMQDLPDAMKSGEIDANNVDMAVTSVMSQVHFLSNTIDDFRIFFKPVEDMVVFSVKESVKKALAMIGTKLSHDVIQVETDWGNAKDCSVKGYPIEFQQVVFNLINNARDAILEKDELEGENGCIKIRMSNLNSEILVEVEDNGIGIPSHVKQHIFEPYFSTKETDKGMGISLYMSRMIVERSMGGKIEFTSSSHATVFSVYLKQA